jgi:hypothetical protein
MNTNLLLEWGLTPYDMNRKPRPVVSTVLEIESPQLLAATQQPEAAHDLTDALRWLHVP